jgi:hypothetical protein
MQVSLKLKLMHSGTAQVPSATHSCSTQQAHLLQYMAHMLNDMAPLQEERQHNHNAAARYPAQHISATGMSVRTACGTVQHACCKAFPQHNQKESNATQQHC